MKKKILLSMCIALALSRGVLIEGNAQNDGLAQTGDLHTCAQRYCDEVGMYSIVGPHDIEWYCDAHYTQYQREHVMLKKDEYLVPEAEVEGVAMTHVTHYCDADGCTNVGTESYVGLSGETEWYCDKHYDEILDTIGMMEKTVGTGSASKHTCEECSKEGTHSIVGLSGQTEYYCTEHYNEMEDILKTILGD